MSRSAACDEMLELAAAAAVDALDEADAKRVEEHAATCPSCASALYEFREAASVLGAAVDQVEPPAGLRTRVLDAARQTQRTAMPRPRRRWPRLSLRPAWVAVAASLALSVFSIMRVVAMQNEISNLHQITAAQDARYDNVVAVLASDQLAIKPLQPAQQSVQSRGTVYLDPLSGRGMVMCRDLPPVEPGHAWQIWFVRGNERVSGGMLWPDGAGNGYTLISVPQDLQSFDSIGLTDEPGNGGRGSAWPTTARVMGTVLR